MTKTGNGHHPEQLTCRKDFVETVIPGINQEGSRILEISGRVDLFSLLKKEFPEADVEQLDIEARLTENAGIKSDEIEPFDYITAAGLKYVRCDSHRLFRQLLDLLKPGGVISAVCLGFSGYYGVAMLASVISKLTRGKDLKEIIPIAKAVIAQLPPTHPAFEQETFMERLKACDEEAFKELLTLSEDKLYTVSRLLEFIPQWGGKFMGWAFPRLYDPSQEIDDPEIIQQLNDLPEPRRSVSAELVNASPPEHYFLYCRQREGGKDYLDFIGGFMYS